MQVIIIRNTNITVIVILTIVNVLLKKQKSNKAI